MWNDIKNLCKAFYVLFKHLWESLGNLLVWAIRFFGPTAKSIKGIISPEEFYRVILMALSASGSFYGFIQYLTAHINEFVTDPNLITGIHAFTDHIEHKHIAAAIFTVLFVGDYIRRKYVHGESQ